MLYRRKLLLALVEAFGGSLNQTDWQKLLFLFCQKADKNYYDFLTYRSKFFSFTAQHDKKRLADLGFFKAQDTIELNDGQSFLQELRPQDRVALQKLVAEIGDTRGEKFSYKAGLQLPGFDFMKQTESCIEPCLFTLGYEGLSIDSYISYLLTYNVRLLIDVRKNPISMKYGFSRSTLIEYTKCVDIQYLHIPDLGVPSHLRRNLGSAASYQILFDYYQAHILPDQVEAIEKLKGTLQEQRRVALTCFEADHKFCHRHKITEYLEHDPDFLAPIIHLRTEKLVNAG